MSLPDWRTRPTTIDSLPRSIKHALFIDEYGDHSFKHVDYCIRKDLTPEPDKRYLGLCGAIFHMDEHEQTMYNIVDLKNTHWPPDGKHILAIKNSDIPCRVCLHSTEIKSSKGAFSRSVVDSDRLNNDIGEIMSERDFKLIACVVDKYAYSKRYKEAKRPPYGVAAEFMLERFAREIAEENSHAAVILESRGQKEDASVLSYLCNILDNGNYYNGKSMFKNISGVFFNPKRSCNKQLSYIGLEVVDLCCSTLVRATINPETAVSNRAYQCIKTKIRGYPTKIKGWGIKLIP